MSGTAVKSIKVTQIASTAGRLPVHRSCMQGLGLRRIGHSVVLQDTPSIRGMVNKVHYLVKVENA